MTTERRQVLELLSELSDLYPDMRLGQFLTWFACAARGQAVEAIYDAEDNELLAVMKSHVEKRKADLTASRAKAV